MNADTCCCRVATLGEALELVHRANTNGKNVGVFVQVSMRAECWSAAVATLLHEPCCTAQLC